MHVAQASSAAPGHHALASISELGRIKRHYTLNIDGLAEVVGATALCSWAGFLLSLQGCGSSRCPADCSDG